MHTVEDRNIGCTESERRIADSGFDGCKKRLGVHEFEHRIVTRVRQCHRHIRCIEDAKRSRQLDGEHNAHRRERMIRPEVVRRKFIGPDDGQRVHEINSSKRARALFAGELARPVARCFKSGQESSANAVVLKFADRRDGGPCR
jgi:hypothetical protein